MTPRLPVPNAALPASAATAVSLLLADGLPIVTQKHKAPARLPTALGRSGNEQCPHKMRPDPGARQAPLTA